MAAVPEKVNLDVIDRAARDAGLSVLGAMDDPAVGGTRVLVGPDEPGGFWQVFSQSAEAGDGAPDPMNRWSERVVGGLADRFGAVAQFPFGGPPWHPYHVWALATGRCHNSPVSLLVHDRAGLWVSFRGALLFADRIVTDQPPPNPCVTCVDKPCLGACPVGALTEKGYDVPACKAYLAGGEGAACMNGGCRVRAACPVSQKWGRSPLQSAFHMRAFLGE